MITKSEFQKLPRKLQQEIREFSNQPFKSEAERLRLINRIRRVLELDKPVYH